MTRTELGIAWVIAALPLVFVALLLTTPPFREFLGPWVMLAFYGVYLFKEWILRDEEEKRKRRERAQQPIPKKRIILVVLLLPGIVAFILLLNWLESLVGKEPIIGAFILAMAALWVKECLDAWKKYVASRP